jgi:thiazole synthase
MEEAILASASELVTVALKRIDLETETDAILKHLQHSHINLLPNTSGLETLKKLFCCSTCQKH